MAGLTFTKDLAIIPVAGCDRIAKNFIIAQEKKREGNLLPSC
jgi:hypothetical protein